MPKGNKYISLKAICPYYKSEERQLIYCTGLMAGTAIHLAFAYPGEKVTYKERFCERKYEKCRLAKMLKQQDEEMEDEI